MRLKNRAQENMLMGANGDAFQLLMGTRFNCIKNNQKFEEIIEKVLKKRYV